MKIILKLEELGMWIGSIFLYHQLSFEWKWYLFFFLVPDISMLGYLFGSKMGALSYNIFHHKGIAVLVLLLGYFFNNQYVEAAGLILFGHSCFDRFLGYGLKYETGFKFTHLGEIGKK